MGTLLDAATEQIIGTFDRTNGKVSLIDKKSKAKVEEESNLIDPLEYQQRGEKLIKEGRYRDAACLFDEALKGCSQLRATDLDLECGILRDRITCSIHLGAHKNVIDDAERILAIHPEDFEAQELKQRFTDLQSNPAAVFSEVKPLAGKRANCSHCNDVADRCPKCGVGMERCASCSKPVSRVNCCARCHRAYYCDRACQRAHWKQHKLECR